jgi:hypothetical protein
MGDEERACYHCGATDTELIPIAAWVVTDPDVWFCLDIFACYQRAGRDEI